MLPAHVTLKVRAAGCARTAFRLVHYSLQDNHAHLLVEARDRDALGRGMKAIAARLARAVNRVAGRRGPVLKDRYHHRVLPTPREVHRALRYVLLNAQRHSKTPRFAGTVTFDPSSSARWFDGWKRGSASSKAGSAERPAVARARTWLLAVGWRRYGLLDPMYASG